MPTNANRRAAAFTAFSQSIGNNASPRIFHTMLRSSNTMNQPPRRSPIHRQPRFNNNNRPSSRNNAAKKIQAALRGWLARQKHLPKNKFRTVVNPNGTILVAIKPTRLGAASAAKIAKSKQHNRYINRLRGL
jgi:hypothetical protein